MLSCARCSAIPFTALRVDYPNRTRAPRRSSLSHLIRSASTFMLLYSVVQPAFVTMCNYCMCASIDVMQTAQHRARATRRDGLCQLNRRTLAFRFRRHRVRTPHAAARLESSIPHTHYAHNMRRLASCRNSRGSSLRILEQIVCVYALNDSTFARICVRIGNSRQHLVDELAPLWLRSFVAARTARCNQSVE